MNQRESIFAHPLVSEILATWPGAVVTMQEPNSYEVEGLYAGSAKGGEYLESIGKTDLAMLSEAEWMCFIESVVRGYEHKTMQLYSPNGEMPMGPPD